MSPAPHSPFERIEKLYLTHPQEHTLLEYVEWHLRNGLFVFSRPDFFIMGRPIPRNHKPLEDITENLKMFHVEQCDCWYVFALAGNLVRAWEILPYQMPWLAWERIIGGKRVLRFYPSSHIERLSRTI